MSECVDEELLRAKVLSLEKELAKQKKINAALKQRVKRNMQDEGSAYSLFEKNVQLQHEIERQTQSLREAMLEAEEANEAKSEFLANVSHELRTPIHAILGLSTLGREDFESNELDQFGDYFENIHKSGRRLLTFVNDLLDISKLESQQIELSFKFYDLYELIQAIVKEFDVLILEKSIEVELVKPEFDTRIRADKIYIEQLLQNLLSNALKFTPDGRKVSLVFYPDVIESKGGLIDAVGLAVVDQGIGVPENELESIFNKFIQSSKTNQGTGGTGLGLAICRQIMLHHGGNVWAVNNADHGATFLVNFPKVTSN